MVAHDQVFALVDEHPAAIGKLQPRDICQVGEPCFAFIPVFQYVEIHRKEFEAHKVIADFLLQLTLIFTPISMQLHGIVAVSETRNVVIQPALLIGLLRGFHVLDKLRGILVVKWHGFILTGAATISFVQLYIYALLGILQGLTEFLPVSSSGHLVLAQNWLKLDPPGVVLEISLHVATLFSVVIVYRKDIGRIIVERNWRYIGLAAAATAVTVAIVLPLKDWLSAIADGQYAVKIVGAMLLLTAAWLMLADLRLRKGGENKPLGWVGAVLTGLAQAIAAVPGISRSGATIGTLIQLGCPRVEAARFSFLLSIPIILGAGIITAKDIPTAIAAGQIDPLGLSVAFILALLSGIAAIHFVLKLLKQARLSMFALYCALLGTLALATG